MNIRPRPDCRHAYKPDFVQIDAHLYWNPFILRQPADTTPCTWNSFISANEFIQIQSLEIYLSRIYVAHSARHDKRIHGKDGPTDNPLKDAHPARGSDLFMQMDLYEVPIKSARIWYRGFLKSAQPAAVKCLLLFFAHAASEFSDTQYFGNSWFPVTLKIFDVSHTFLIKKHFFWVCAFSLIPIRVITVALC
jgi:hypothetical protein